MKNENDLSLIYAIVLFILCLTGSIINFIVMFLILNKKHRTRNDNDNNINKNKNQGHYFILIQLFIADFLLCFFNGIVFCYKIWYIYLTNKDDGNNNNNNDNNDNNYSHLVICKFQGVCGILFASLSIILMLIIAYDRYVTIVLSRKIKKLQLQIYTLSAWLISSALGFGLLSKQLSIVQTPSHVFCSTEWENDSFANIFYSCVCLAILILSLILTTGFYYKIHLVTTASAKIVAQTFKRRKSVLAIKVNVNIKVKGDKVKNNNHNNNDSNIAYRMLTLIIVFIIGWTTYCSMILYNLITSQAANSGYDLAATVLSFLNSTLNPMIYLMLNRKKFKLTSKFKCSSTTKETTVNATDVDKDKDRDVKHSKHDYVERDINIPKIVENERKNNLDINNIYNINNNNLDSHYFFDQKSHTVGMNNGSLSGSIVINNYSPDLLEVGNRGDISSPTSVKYDFRDSNETLPRNQLVSHLNLTYDKRNLSPNSNSISIQQFD